MRPTSCHALRHGTTGKDGLRGRLDDPLTPEGWQQMLDSVATQRWARIVTSPRRRCQPFAEYLAAHWQVPLIIDDDLVELDFGDWEGRSVADLAREEGPALAAFWRDPRQHPPPKGESFDHFSQRVQRVWSRVQQQSEATLLTTHGGVIRYWHHWLTGSPLSAFLLYPVAHGSLHEVNEWALSRSGNA